jgi:tripartite-type tricarboxylate transporter receptor subunit TctC
MARLIAQKLSDSLGKQFYIENHPGAGGNLGMAMVANAAPDGYTLLLVSSSVVVNPSLYEKVPYDVYKSLAPVTLAGSSPNILVVHPSVPAKNVKELIAYVQANPDNPALARQPASLRRASNTHSSSISSPFHSMARGLRSMPSSPDRCKSASWRFRR